MPVPDSAEPGDWLHGWQHHASSSSEVTESRCECGSPLDARSQSVPEVGKVAFKSPANRTRHVTSVPISRSHCQMQLPTVAIQTTDHRAIEVVALAFLWRSLLLRCCRSGNGRPLERGGFKFVNALPISCGKFLPLRWYPRGKTLGRALRGAPDLAELFAEM